MYATALAPQVWQRWRKARQLVLLAAFEDSVTGSRTKEFCQDLSRQLGQDCRVIQHVWLFNMFRLRELREIAAEEAAAADLVVICLHHEPVLPPDVQRWLDLWSQQKGERRPVLLALLEPGREGAPHPVEASLRAVARQGGIEFLVEPWPEVQ
jgi:hypothetical protein